MCTWGTSMTNHLDTAFHVKTYSFSDSVFSVSIARRVQDPLAELVKIEPKHIGVGMYQVKQCVSLIYETHQYKEQYSNLAY